jgi:CRISPR system Cascade subunit CasB
MPSLDVETGPHTPDRSPNGAVDSISRLARIMGQAARFTGDAYGLDSGQRAAIARMDPDDMRPHQVAALTRALVAAELAPEYWRPDTWRRWGLIAQGMALTGHESKRNLGQQLCTAAVAESRVTRLLTARGVAFRQLLPRLVRLLAAKEIAPNWRELGALILQEGRNEREAEAIRLRIAGRYFSTMAKSAVKQSD